MTGCSLSVINVCPNGAQGPGLWGSAELTVLLNYHLCLTQQHQALIQSSAVVYWLYVSIRVIIHKHNSVWL